MAWQYRHGSPAETKQQKAKKGFPAHDLEGVECLEPVISCRVVAKMMGDGRMAEFMEANRPHECYYRRKIDKRILEKFSNEKVHGMDLSTSRSIASGTSPW